MSNVLPLVEKLPGLIESSHLFTMFFGAGTTCKSRKIPLDIDSCAVVATYHDNDGAISRLLVCDVAFANCAGAALTAIPPMVASQATKSGTVADNVYDNLVEVMNVAVNLFTEAFGGRLELGRVVKKAEFDEQIVAALQSTSRVRMDITIPRYETGRVDLIAVRS